MHVKERANPDIYMYLSICSYLSIYLYLPICVCVCVCVCRPTSSTSPQSATMSIPVKMRRALPGATSIRTIGTPGSRQTFGSRTEGADSSCKERKKSLG